MSETPRSSRPVVWSIASSDCSGGAGIQADLVTINRLGAYGCSVITGLTVQNSVSFTHMEPVTPELIRQQIEALIDDMPPAAIKTGMFGSAEALNLITNKLSHMDVPVICDPVIQATMGSVMIDVQSRVNLLQNLLPITRLITPNTGEATLLTDVTIETADDMRKAADVLLGKGTHSVLVKGGHREGALALDYWSDGKNHAWLSSPRIETRNQHGTGCTLSAAIAALIAQGYPDLEAVIIGKAYVNQGLHLATPIGAGRGPLFHGGWPGRPEYLPALLASADEVPAPCPFPSLDVPLPDVYPIVDRANWIQRLASSGARMMQLRVKDLSGAALEHEVKSAIAIGRKRDARVFINDHWQLALKHGAYGVHLGQDDLAGTDFAAIHKAGMRLGLSTHNIAELARSKAFHPTYTAIGTLFASPSKSFVHQPLGLQRFDQLRGLAEKPVVAIGGITLDKARNVFRHGADIVSVISDITAAREPENRMRSWRSFCDEWASQA